MRGFRLGIVGSEAAKFTPETEYLARRAIRELIAKYKPVTVVSGGCHLGGIDIWAIEEATTGGRDLAGHTIVGVSHLPEVLEWDPPGKVGYKARNLAICKDSDAVFCITVKDLPEGYMGMRFEECYHHRGEEFVPSHVKSGGCWTVAQAKRLGKRTGLVVIP